MGQRFFPLDEELGLLPGHYTPRLQEAMTRWGSKMTFQEAVDEIKVSYRTEISEATTRRTTYQNGRAGEALAQQRVEELEATAPDPTVEPEHMVISTDGAFIALTNGEWREVKTVAIGEFTSQWNPKKSQVEVKSSDLSYFSRSYPVREFERLALVELHHRGVEKAKKVVTVNDGAVWIQSFVDYHCPRAVRILDFPTPKATWPRWARCYWVKRQRPSKVGMMTFPINSNMNRPNAFCESWPGTVNRPKPMNRRSLLTKSWAT